MFSLYGIKCINCNIHCNKCDSKNSSCTECEFGYEVNSTDGTCIECGDNEFSNGKKCFKKKKIYPNVAIKLIVIVVILYITFSVSIIKLAYLKRRTNITREKFELPQGKKLDTSINFHFGYNEKLSSKEKLSKFPY